MRKEEESMHFYHLTIITRDFEKSLKFYTEFVGLNVQRKETTPGKPFIAFLADKAEDTQIEIVHYDAPFYAEARGVTICFQTDDVEAMHKKAEEYGLTPVSYTHLCCAVSSSFKSAPAAGSVFTRYRAGFLMLVSKSGAAAFTACRFFRDRTFTPCVTLEVFGVRSAVLKTSTLSSVE